jgi:hypothetical protein
MVKVHYYVSVINFMNGIYSYILATNHIPTICNVRAILCFRFMVNVMQF